MGLLFRTVVCRPSWSGCKPSLGCTRYNRCKNRKDAVESDDGCERSSEEGNIECNGGNFDLNVFFGVD